MLSVTPNVGKYQLVRKLATGGMAEVYLAKAAGPMGFEKTLVLKRILPHLAEEATFVAMFLAEAKLAAQLTHPHIVQIFDFGEVEGAYFLAMEYIDGPSLRTLIKRSVAQRTPLPVTLCARIISQACEALAFAHDFAHPETGQPLGLIHRDISPDNILLSRQGTAKVVDFGIAKAADPGGHRTATGVIKGKVSYMPPEQVRARQMDRRVDVYALGVVLYELLTARKPFEVPSEVGLMQAILFEQPAPAEQHRPDLPGPLLAILARALAKDRDQRYPDCHAFQADLEEFILTMGKPVTTQQVAQLIQHLTANAEPAATPPPGTPLPSPETRVPSPETRVPSPPARTPKPAPPRLGAEDASQIPTQKAPLTSQAERQPVPFEDAPITAVGDVTERRAPTRAGRGWAVGSGLGLLLLVGGGALLWTRSTAPEAVKPLPPALAKAPRVEAPPQEEPKPTSPEPAPAPAPTPEPVPEPAPEPVPEPAPAPTPPAGPEEGQEPPVVTKPLPKEPRRAPAPPKPTAKGTLDLRVRPYATVYVDGKKLGDTPLAPPALIAGRHVVRLVNAELGEKTYDIVIEPNTPYVLKVNLFE